MHTTIDLDPIDRETCDGLPITAPARTLIDLVRFEPADRVTIAIDCALRDGGTTETHLHGRIARLRTKGRHGMPELLRILEGSELIRGGQSWLERRFLELVAEAGLPRPDTRQVLTRAKDRPVRVDFHFPRTRIVVEVLGYRFHRTLMQMQRDTERMNRLLLEGYVVLQFTYLHVTESPQWVVGQVREAFRFTPPVLCVTTKADVGLCGDTEA